jgi:hypothetical protein
MNKRPRLFSDLIAFYKIYWPHHLNLPKPFRLSAGEKILRELNQSLALVAAANLADHNRPEDRREAAECLRTVRIGLEAARALLLLAWEMKFISSAVLSDLDHRLEDLAQQAARWREWFGKNGPTQK